MKKADLEPCVSYKNMCGVGYPLDSDLDEKNPEINLRELVKLFNGPIGGKKGR